MIQTIALYNNEGAQLIACGKYDEAIQYFLRSMQYTKQTLRNIEPPSSSSSSSSESESSGQKSVPFHGSDSMEIDHDDNDDSSSSSLIHDYLDVSSPSCHHESLEKSCFVFQKAIVVSSPNGFKNHDGDNADNDSEVYSSASSISALFKLAIITLYNLALAHHLSGLQSQSKELLVKARRYYELSHKLQEQHHVGSGPTTASCSGTGTGTSGLNILYSLSVLNNVGAIHQVMNEQESSERFFGKLLSALTYLRENGNFDPSLTTTTNNNNNGNNHSSAWKGFWSNASSSIMCTPTAAGAA